MIEVGCVVALRSGGPDMTVVGFCPEKPEVCCVYWHLDEFHHIDLHPDALVHRDEHPVEA